MKVREADRLFVWHPYTQMKDWISWENTVIDRGSEFNVIDENGMPLLDGIANMWCNVWGHGSNGVTRAMIDQIEKIPHSTLFGLVNEPAAALSRKLVEMAPGMARAFFTDNGSSAIEVSLKMALQYWRNTGRKRKTRFISLTRGYHGDTSGAMSVGYIDQFFGAYKPILFRSIRVPSPMLYGSGFKDDAELMNHCLNSLERTLKKHAPECAALVMESGAQIAGGVAIYPPGFQREVYRLCRAHDVLLILDEIATGFGRLGNMIEYIGQRSPPDIVCFGKALTAGYFPLAATLATKEIFDAFNGEFFDRKQLFHGHTFSGHSVGCAAAVANIKMYEEADLIRQIQKMSKHLARRVKEFKEYDVVEDIRHRGLLAGIELARDGKPLTRLSDGQPVSYFVLNEAKKMGVFLRSLGNIMLIIPPLAIGIKDLDKIVDVELALVKRIEKLS